MQLMMRFLPALVFFGLAASTACGDTLNELQARFKARYPQLEALKQAGVIGETDQGTVEAVQPVDGDTARLLRAENADRAALYALLAKREGTTPDHVARRNALRNFSKAEPEEYLKKEGVWIRK